MGKLLACLGDGEWDGVPLAPISSAAREPEVRTKTIGFLKWGIASRAARACRPALT